MSKKHITLKIPVENWKAARWIINSFQWAIHKTYEEGAPRRIEADYLAEDLHEQARKQVNSIEDGAYDT